MSMTVVVARNASSRIRGFLASTMLELVPGVYSASQLSPAVRDRIWQVIENWFPNEQGASLIMLWQERKSAGGQSIRVLGEPPIEFVDVDRLILARRS